MSSKIVNYKLYIIHSIPYLILVLAIGFNLYFLWPELRILADLNDNVFAFALINRANDIINNCSLLTASCFSRLLDHWVSYWAMGYPLPHYYQHLPSIFIVVLYRLFSPLMSISLFDVFNVVKYLLYAVFPLAVYYSARKFDFPPLAAAFSAFLANLISTNYQYGTDYGAVIWRGSGMHTQLWGMILLPLAVSSIYSALKNLHFSQNNPNLSKIPNLSDLGNLVNLILNTKYLILNSIPAIFFLTLSFHAHVLFGYIAILSSAFLPFLFAFRSLSLDSPSKRSNCKLYIINYTFRFLPYLLNLFLIYFFSFLLLSYWLIPLILNNDLHAHSVWDDYWKFNSFGSREVIQRWVEGSIFDYNRFPVMTILVLTGFFAGLISYLSNLGDLLASRGHNEDGDNPKLKVNSQLNNSQLYIVNSKLYIPLLFLPLMLIFWTLMYFGRQTWGGLIDLLPMAEGIHMHRFINGIHFTGIFLTGFGLYWILVQLGKLKSAVEKMINLISPQPSILKFLILNSYLLILFLALSPIIRERTEFLNHNTYLINYGNNAFSTDMKAFQPILDRLTLLQKEKPGRIWAGRPGNWGREFKVGMVSVFLTLSVRGFDSLGFEPESWSPNTDFEQFFDENRLDHYNLFNIRYIIAPRDQKVPDFAKNELTSGKYTLYTVETNGNFDPISVPYLLKTDKEAVLNYVHSWISSKWPAKSNHMIITYGKGPTYNYEINKIPPSQITTLNGLDWSNYQVSGKDYNLLSYNPFDATPSAVAKVNFMNEKVTLDNYSVTVDTPQNTLIMLKATYHPFWEVKVTPVNSGQLSILNSQLSIKYMVSPAFMAIGVPAGRNEISFTYKIAEYKKLLILVSFLILLFLVTAFVIDLRLPKKLKGK